MGLQAGTFIPLWILSNNTLKPLDKLILADIHYFVINKGRYYKSNAYIAYCFNISSTTTVQASINRMVGLGYISKTGEFPKRRYISCDIKAVQDAYESQLKDERTIATVIAEVESLDEKEMKLVEDSIAHFKDCIS